MALSELLARVEPDVIDYLDLDIQLAEVMALTEPGVMTILHARLKRIHAETHSEDVHLKLRKLFTAEGWHLYVDPHYTPEPPIADTTKTKQARGTSRSLG